MPNCSLATSEVRRPWWTRFSSIDKLPSTFPRSSPCSIPRSKPCSIPYALAVSKAQSCANKACSSRLRCSLNIFLSSSDQLLQSSSWSAWLMARSGCWVKGLFPKNSNHGLRTSSLLVSLYFFSPYLLCSFNNASNSETVIPNCWLATSEVKRPWRTISRKVKTLPSTFPRSSPCSRPSARPRSNPLSSACSKAQSCANKACSSRLRCSLNIFLSSSDQLLQSSSWSAWLMVRSGCWVKGLFPKNSNHGLRILSLLVSLYFYLLFMMVFQQ